MINLINIYKCHSSLHSTTFNENQRKFIINWFNNNQKIANRLYDDYKKTGNEGYLKSFNDVYKSMTGAAEMLSYIDCYVGYDWVGHRGEWFFVEEEDIDNQEDYMFQCKD